tara:strand:- start:5138 stop:6316 length:1179 start_codon:yes stop_codon:yes gene_type:complete
MSDSKTLLNNTGENYKKAVDYAKKTMEQMKNNKIFFFSILISIILVVSTIFYIHHKLTLDKANCKNLLAQYPIVPRLNSVSNNPNFNTYKLRDFYIKSAFNCCSPGNFRNDFVNLCALSTCISQGVRFLDFEIYSMNDQPVIATSSIQDFTVKETYNYIPISQALDMIVQKAFSSGTCPNFQDPLILHFRIMSNNCKMYNNLANIISENRQFNSKTLGKKFSFEFKDPEHGGQNLGAISLCSLNSKIIISVDASNPIYQHTKFDEYVNIASGSVFMRMMTDNQIKFTQDLDLTDFNKRNMSIVIPTLGNRGSNPNFNIARNYGCQFCAMSFQTMDTNLQHYIEFFNENSAAFVLKPDSQRFIPVTISKPAKQDPKLSYATRKIESDFYNYNI